MESTSTLVRVLSELLVLPTGFDTSTLSLKNNVCVHAFESVSTLSLKIKCYYHCHCSNLPKIILEQKRKLIFQIFHVLSLTKSGKFQIFFKPFPFILIWSMKWQTYSERRFSYSISVIEITLTNASMCLPEMFNCG